jgi:hypothetical protein
VHKQVLRSGGGRHAESGMSNLKGGPSMSKNKPR